MGRAFEFRKARKMKRWAGMAKTFTKIGREISIAVKAAGPDPTTNARLRVLLQNAKSANMPKDNVERAIKKATSRDEADYEELVYEGYGPHGIAILVETTTDNPIRTVANVRSYFNKYNGSLGKSGSVEFLFERKCIFRIPANGINLEEFEFELIDYGSDEVFQEDDEILIYGDFPAFGGIQRFLEEKGIEVLHAQFERIPMDTKQLTPEQEADLEKLLEKLEDDDDVQNVYHTMA
ncbi:MAG: YebC/PmpR family DNA-binding transcriptional regulator [Bacteroidia bacterium]|nr:YebC/PmpR family DNA-binding transcriptional regulator [Bacteroidia bacterium]